MSAAFPRLFGRRRRYRELEGLHEISQAFAAMTDIQETYGRLTRRIAELIGAETCVITVRRELDRGRRPSRASAALRRRRAGQDGG